MNVSQYIDAKYKGSKFVSLASYEAKAFGVPYPLRGGWHKEFGSIEITEEMCDELIDKMRLIASASDNGKKVAAAVAGLAALGENAPINQPLEGLRTRNRALSKQRKKKNKNKLDQQIAQARNALNKANKKFKPAAPVQMRGPTEQSVKSFIQNHSTVNPASDNFLNTFEWRATRMMALRKYGPVCQCCGASPQTGAVMHVDHIKPRKIFPQLALEVDNLQILCGECNQGKGNWDMTDWRTQSIPTEFSNTPA